MLTYDEATALLFKHGVTVMPDICFGNPHIVRTRITTSIIRERFSAGESVRVLSAEYGLSKGQIEGALRYELLPRSLRGRIQRMFVKIK